MKSNKIIGALASVWMFLLLSGSALAASGDPYYGDTGLGLLTGGYCILAIVMLIIDILILVWVYKDAKKRGASAALWVIIVFFLGIIGLIIWLVVRPPIQQQPYGPVVINQYQQPQYPQPYQAPPQQQQYYQQPPQQGQANPYQQPYQAPTHQQQNYQQPPPQQQQPYRPPKQDDPYRRQ